MKLVDILATELKEWPETAEFAWQDWNREIRFHGAMHSDFYVRPLAQDNVRMQYQGSPRTGVTRAQWQAAVDALKAGKQVWDGEDLPPIGQKVIIGDCGGNATLSRFSGREATIIAHNTAKDGEPTAVFKTFGDQGFPIYHALVAGNGNFERVRTAEQIAEQAHREAVEELAAATDWILTREACEAVLAAGYRKQVQP